jgi:hypothetical protein
MKGEEVGVVPVVSAAYSLCGATLALDRCTLSYTSQPGRYSRRT